MASADVKPGTSAGMSKPTAAQTPSASTGQETRIILFGKTGNGKSATCNMILGQERSKAKKSQSSVTKKCKSFRKTLKDGKTFLVVDTPGLYDTDRDHEKTIDLIIECTEYPGPHAFLLILSCNGRYTDEEHDTIMELKELFGDTVYQHTIVVFTSVDTLEETTIKEYTKDFPQYLQDIITSCNDRVIYVNNKHPDANNKYCGKLFKMIDAMVEENKGYYRGEIFGTHMDESKKTERIRRMLDRKTKQLEYLVWLIDMLKNGAGIDDPEHPERMFEARKHTSLSEVEKEKKIEELEKQLEQLKKDIKKQKGWCSIL